MFVGQKCPEETTNKTSLDVCFGQLAEAGCTRFYHHFAPRCIKDTLLIKTVIPNACLASMKSLKIPFQSSGFNYSHRLKTRKVLQKPSSPQRLILKQLPPPSRRTRRNVVSVKVLKRITPNATICPVNSSLATLHLQRSYQNFDLSPGGIETFAQTSVFIAYNTYIMYTTIQNLISEMFYLSKIIL